MTNQPMKQIDSTHDVTIALHHLGGDGPPLMICHATGFHGRAYQTVANTLAESFTVWAIDFRAQGASTSPTGGNYAWANMADDLLVCLDELGIESLPAFGHSMGASAVLLAEQKRPGTISAAYLFEPIVFPQSFIDERTENPLAGPARKRRPVFESRQAAFDRYASRPPLNTLDPQALRDYVDFGFVDIDSGEVRLACEPEDEAQVFDSEDKVTVERLASHELVLRAAIAVGAPNPDGPNPAEFGPAIANAIDGAHLVTYDDLGHFGPLQDPQRIAADVLAHLLPTT